MERADYLAWRQSQARPAPAAQMDRADWLFWEQNTQLPTSEADESSGIPSGGQDGCPTGWDRPDCLFYEQNTTLPTSGAPAGGLGIQGVNG
jgi:hypothetical protein